MSSIVEMVNVEGGIFQMGDEYGDLPGICQPVHRVTLSDFYIGKFQITQRQFQMVMGKNPSFFRGENNPVEEITWYDAVEFCNKLSEMDRLTKCYKDIGGVITCDFTAKGYRLPTEAEWEYAARGGKYTKGLGFSGSNNSTDVAWYDEHSNSTQPVGTKRPNELGIYDMSGNVWEWCWDGFGGYKIESVISPTGGQYAISRVLRGGSWYDIDNFVRCAYRYSEDPTAKKSRYSNGTIGFRISKSK